MTTDFERQVAWEREGVEEGKARYERAVAKSAPGQTPAEMNLATTLMIPLVPAVKKAQAQALDCLKAGGEMARVFREDWMIPILYLSPEKLAAITIKSALTEIPGIQTLFKQMTTVAFSVANHVKQERDYELWREAQNKSEGTNYYKLMISLVNVVDKRTVSKWMKKGETFDKVGMQPREKVILGSKLLSLMIDASPGYFEVKPVPITSGKKYRTYRCLLPGPAHSKFIKSANSRLEVARPWLLPMVHPPKDWSIVNEIHRRIPDDAAASHTDGVLRTHEGTDGAGS